MSDYSEHLKLENPACWQGSPLRYTDHATQRAYERDLPCLLYVPSDAAAVWFGQDEWGKALVKFKVSFCEKCFFMLVSEDAEVITVHDDSPKPPKSYDKKREKSGYTWITALRGRCPDFLLLEFPACALTRRERIRRACRAR